MAQLLILVGTAGWLVCLGCLIALHWLPTGFNPLHDPVSNYAASRYGALYGLQASASGVSGAALLGLLALTGHPWPALGVGALAAYALARLLIAFFPTDVKPPRTRTGTLHILLAILTFAGIATAAGVLSPAFAGQPAWSGLGAALVVAAFITEASAILFLGTWVAGPLRPFVGLVERGIYLGALLWLGLVWVALLLALR